LSRCQRAQEEFFEFKDREESKEKDLHRVTEHPADSERSCLRKGYRRASISPSDGGGKGKSLRVLSRRKISEEIAPS
jgi:hypothetical protein